MRLSLSSTACLEVVGVETHHAHVRTLFQVEAEERRAAIAAKKKRPGTNSSNGYGSSVKSAKPRHVTNLTT